MKHRPFRLKSDSQIGSQFTTYADDGCEVAASCLRCPLETCRHDEVSPGESWGFMHRYRARARNALIRAAAAQGAKRAEIAEAAGLTERSVYRLIQEAK